MNPSYYLFEKLSEEDRAANNIRSANRFECIKMASPELVHPLQPSVKKSGMLWLYMSQADAMIQANRKRKAQYVLTDGKNNISSMYFEDLENSLFAYGYPNPKEKLANNEANPYFSIRNHVLLFKVNQDFTSMEVLVFPDAKQMVKGYYSLFIDGDFEDLLKACRQDALEYYSYNKAKK
jgi:hypothetical protein